jgi:16S rRNA (guanine527-N7)-methyltransferase
MTPRTALERGLKEMALDLPEGTRDQLLAYTALLAKWNRTYNLTAIRDPLAMVSHHLLDALAVLPHLHMPDGNARVADIGSGAGVPGIPIALARPQWQVTLVESNQKKATFLRQAKIELALANVQIHEGRVEAWRPERPFAIAISRAFAELADFVSACRHVLAPAGVIAAMKGKDAGDEIARLPAGVRCAAPIVLRVPFVDGARHLLLCELP